MEQMDPLLSTRPLPCPYEIRYGSLIEKSISFITVVARVLQIRTILYKVYTGHQKNLRKNPRKTSNLRKSLFFSCNTLY